MFRWGLLFVSAFFLTALLVFDQSPHTVASSLPPTRDFSQVFTPTRTPTRTLRPTITPTLTQEFCPQATDEPLYVKPITSPTNLFSQDINVWAYRFVWIKIESESGLVLANGPFGGYAVVTVPLLPETIHHLRVTVLVQGYTIGHCVYPPYQLSTGADSHGRPLVIHQTKSIVNLTVTAISPGHLTPTATRTPWPSATTTRTPTRTPIGLRTPQPITTPEARPRPAFP